MTAFQDAVAALKAQGRSGDEILEVLGGGSVSRPIAGELGAPPVEVMSAEQHDATVAAVREVMGVSEPLTDEALDSMTPAEINSRWDEVQQVLAAQGRRAGKI